MGNQASVADIISFLENAKRLVSAEKYDFLPRRKNMQVLAQHGLTITDAKAEILGLVVGDYYKVQKQVSIPELSEPPVRRMRAIYSGNSEPPYWALLHIFPLYCKYVNVKSCALAN